MVDDQNECTPQNCDRAIYGVHSDRHTNESGDRPSWGGPDSSNTHRQQANTSRWWWRVNCCELAVDGRKRMYPTKSVSANLWGTFRAAAAADCWLSTSRKTESRLSSSSALLDHLEYGGSRRPTPVEATTVDPSPSGGRNNHVQVPVQDGTPQATAPDTKGASGPQRGHPSAPKNRP